MRAKKDTPEAKKHGHPDNRFHTVDIPGFSTSFYISGEEQNTLATYLEDHGKTSDKTDIAALAREWFKEMMKQKKNEYSKQMKKSSKNT